MTFAEYIDQRRPNVKLSEAQTQWVAAIDRRLSEQAHSGWGVMLSLLRDYMRFTRG